MSFFWLAVSGVYLWWPRSWRWRALKPSVLFNPPLRGEARDWNWHNVIGFWSSGVLGWQRDNESRWAMVNPANDVRELYRPI